MDSIGGVIWVIIIICIVASNINKSKKKSAAGNGTKSAAPRQARSSGLEDFLSSSAPASEQSATTSTSGHSARPAAPQRFSSGTSSLEGVDPCHEQDLHGPNLRPSIYGTTRQPYVGSLAMASIEGFDPCHEEQADFMTVLETEDLSSEGGAPALTFNWTGSEIQKAVIMQEILRRPCDRVAR